MTLRTGWIEYQDALSSFSRPARQFLLSTLLTWTGNGFAQVLFNLYLVQAGFREAFVGQAISLGGVGLATMALPAGMLAERWGRKRTLVLGALIEAVGMLARVSTPTPNLILAACFVTGAGQAMLAIAAAPFLTEHSTSRERTHLFSTFFAVELVATVVGSFVGGGLPKLLGHLPAPFPHDLLHAYRVTLWLGASLIGIAALPIARIDASASELEAPERPTRAHAVLLGRIAINFFLIGSGAGLVIPFMNLYFAIRFHCSSAQIGTFFSMAQMVTAAAAISAPLLARSFGKLRTATVLQLLSLPFLVTLGAERQLGVAVAAFCARATLMQASSPLFHTYVMEALPAGLRSRATSLNNLVWNVGWAAGAPVSGWIIQRFGYSVPFYVTAALYATATVYFYLSFRNYVPAEGQQLPAIAEAARVTGTEGPLAE